MDCDYMWVSRSLLEVEVFENFYSVVFLAAFVVFLQQIVNFSTLNLGNLLLQLVLKFFQNFSLAESLTYATHSTDIFRVFLSSNQIQLIFLNTLSMQMFLILKSFQHIFKTNLGRRRRLRSWRFISQGFYLSEVLIELSVGLVDIGVFSGRISSELFLKFSDKIDESTGGGPWENVVEFDLTGHIFDQRVNDPFGDVHQRFIFGESSQ